MHPDFSRDRGYDSGGCTKSKRLGFLESQLDLLPRRNARTTDTAVCRKFVVSILVWWGRRNRNTAGEGRAALRLNKSSVCRDRDPSARKREIEARGPDGSQLPPLLLDQTEWNLQSQQPIDRSQLYAGIFFKKWKQKTELQKMDWFLSDVERLGSGQNGSKWLKSTNFQLWNE